MKPGAKDGVRRSVSFGSPQEEGSTGEKPERKRLNDQIIDTLVPAKRQKTN